MGARSIAICYCVVPANLLSAMDDEYAKLIRRMNPPRYFALFVLFFSLISPGLCHGFFFFFWVGD